MITRTQPLALVLATALSGLLSHSAHAAAAQAKTQGDVIYNGPIVNLNQPAPLPAPPAYTNIAPAVPGAPSGVPAKAIYDEDELAALDPHQRGLSLGGPRFGVSYISGGGFDKLATAVKKSKPDAEVDATMTQFGWQAEYRLFRTAKGLTALTELIPLVGGLDQGLALPSATWLVGLRGKNGFEVGVGPNIGLNGGAMMMGMGYTMDMGGINIPFNLAVGRGAYQTTSIAFSTGFNL